MNPGLIFLVLLAAVAAVGAIRAAHRRWQSSPSHPRNLPPLDLQHPLVIELAAELRVLDALPISTPEDRAIWENSRWAFDEKLRTVWSSVYASLPHELEHYLCDVDIRAKDPGYAEYQRDSLAMLLNPSAQ